MENLLHLNRSFIPATDADCLSTGAKLNTRRGAEIDYLNRKENEWYDLTPQNSEQFYKGIEVIIEYLVLKPREILNRS